MATSAVSGAVEVLRMRCLNMAAASAIVAGTALAGVLHAQAGRPAGVVMYEGARLVPGDGASAIEDGAFVVQDGRIAAVGRRTQLAPPSGATRVNLSGKTVIPALNNVHIHIGYEAYTSWSVHNHTPENVVDHLQREAFYGTGAVMTMGDQPTDWAIAFQKNQAKGKFPAAARFFFAAGMAPPGGGPDSILIQGTTPLRAVYEITTPAEARAAVKAISEKNVSQIKIWVDNRDAQRGSRQKMPPEVYSAIVDEAHKHGILVHAHATNMADQKAVVKAGIDVLVHTISNEPLDDEFVAILKEKKPYWAPVMGLGDFPEICTDADRFVAQVLPASTIADIREGRNGFNMPGCTATPDPATLRRVDMLRANFPRMIQAGARLVLSTDAGVIPKYSFGWAAHHEMEMYVKFGLTPADAIVASTSRPTEVLHTPDTGALAKGKRADFVVLNANPLEDIRNTRQIDSVFLNGVRLDRDALLRRWQSKSSGH
jgi:imidazolonepropionase-like amidohydrolase